MGYFLGVDLGTTFVAAAIADGSGVEMFTLGDRSVVTPAIVYLGEDGALVSGDAAGRRAVSRPDRIGREFKRRLGDPTPVMLGGTPYAVTALLGSQLHDVVTRVTETEGAKPDGVVLTHPANWGPFRRELFDEVPQVAGLTGTQTVTEPEAAAAHYATSRQLADGEIIAVYDLGGGTFDATVLRKQRSGIEILGVPEGVERLGGIDFDEAILSFVNYSASGALSELDMGDPQTAIAIARLRQDCVLAKEALSVDTETTIPVFLPHRHFDVRLTRADFEEMIRAPIESTIGTLGRALRSAEVDPAQLSAVLLVGGSSRIPLVSRMVSEELGRPTVVDAHPKYAVALGAATLARAHGGAAAPGPSPAPPRSQRLPSPAPTPAPPDAPPPVVPSPGAGPERSRRWALLAAAVVTVLALVGVGGYVAIQRFGSGGAQLPPPSAAPPTVAPTVAPTEPPGPTRERVAESVPIPSIGPTIPVNPTAGFVAVSPSSRHLYVANRTQGVVTVVDTAVNRVTATIPVPAGPPQFLTFSPDGRTVYVSIWNEERTIAAIGVLDTSTNTVTATIPVRTRPYLGAVTRDGRQLYVPNHDSGTISVIDTATNEVTSEITVAPNPHWIEFSRDGTRAYIANHESNLISFLDTSTNTVVEEVPVQTSPHSVAVHPTRPLVANVNYDAASVTMIDTNTAEVVAAIRVGRNPQEITWSPDGRFAYTANVNDHTVSVISVETMSVTATIPTGDSPTSIAVLPDGTLGYVSNLGDGTLTVLNLAG